MKLSTMLMFVMAIGISISGCNAKLSSPSFGTYTPPLGEIMGLTQMRHSKLWFAGQDKNWDLAKYELGEIEEGLGDVVNYHPVIDKEVKLSDMLHTIVDQPINDVRGSIAEKDIVKFRKSFANLTSACNACHEAAGKEYIVIKIPDSSPYSNQEFLRKPE